MKPRKKFNWLTTLRRLAKRKTPIGKAEHARLVYRADNWPTCACGTLCKRLSKDTDGSPTDNEARELGITFYWNVVGGDWYLALLTFLKIEKRTALLLRKGGKR